MKLNHALNPTYLDDSESDKSGTGNSRIFPS